MADPFSVAGSAVGVISLAITTCQGLLAYYNSWDTQDQNISDAKETITRLQNSVSALQEILPKISSSPAIAAGVEQCVFSCRQGIARLEKFLEKCRKNPAPLSLKDRLRDCRQRAVFPFRQTSLDTLKETVRDLERNLGTALQILQLDASEAGSKQTSALVNLAKSTAFSVDGAGQSIANIDKKVDQIIVAVPQIQEDLTQYVSHGHILPSSLKSIGRRLQAIERSTSQISPELQTTLEKLPSRIQDSLAKSSAVAGPRTSEETSGLIDAKSAMSENISLMDKDARKLQLVLTQRPSLLRTVCDEAGGPEMYFCDAPIMTTQNHFMQNRRQGKRIKQKLYCTCATQVRDRAATRAATYSIRSVSIFKSTIESSKHSVDCPFYIGTEKTTTVEFKMHYYGRLLANAVQASLLIQTGAGGRSINPCLKFHAIVPLNSPAFRVLDFQSFEKFLSNENSSFSAKEVDDYFENALQQLYELFRHGRASPTDTNKHGQTLLHMFCRTIDRRWSHMKAYLETRQNSCTLLLKGLIAAGVALNERDDRGQTALDDLGFRIIARGPIRQDCLLKLFMEMSEAGADLVDTCNAESPSMKWRLKELYLFRHYEHLIEDCNFGRLSAAIIHRRESDVERILQKWPQSIYERNRLGQNPLHLSSTWPKGIVLLFRHGGRDLVDRSDNLGHLPLMYSGETGCSEAVRLILEADSALCSNHVRGQKVFGRNYEHMSDEILCQVQPALVDRRSRLMSLAMAELGREDLEERGIVDDRLPDEKAFDVYKALQCKDIIIPSALRPPFRRTTVFHSNDLTPAIGESLYRCRFTDLDAIDYLGKTPLMMNDYPGVAQLKRALQRASWLISKGADPTHKLGPSWAYGSAAHYQCCWIGAAVSSGFRRPAEDSLNFGALAELEQDCRSLLGKLFSLKLYDDCICACSSHGCTPAIMLLKTMSKEIPRPEQTWGSSDLSSLDGRSWIIEWFNGFLGDCYEIWQWLSQEIIRYETFEKLELTHTCCEVGGYCWMWGPTPRESAECEEILEEEHILISKLETLVAELTDKYTELGVSLPEFLKGYWKTRMEEFEREEHETPFDENEIAKIRELGVVIDT